MTAVLLIGRIAGPAIAITKAATAATEIFATIDAETPDISGLKDPDVAIDEAITFENVAFSYPSRPDVQILDGLNATFEAGKVTAIVGPSGSGKSTVVGLIQRWYELAGTTAKEVTMNKTEDSAPATLLEKESSKGTKKKKAKEDKGTAKSKDEKEAETEEVDLGESLMTYLLNSGSCLLHLSYRTQYMYGHSSHWQDRSPFC